MSARVFCVGLLLVGQSVILPAGCNPHDLGNGGFNGDEASNDTADGIEDVGDDGGLDVDVPPVTEGDWYRPGVHTTWQWQLQPNAAGVINTEYDVDVYGIDLFDVDASVIASLQGAGRRVICYFSAGTFEDWRNDADGFQPAELGRTLEDWPNERWLDIRSSNVHRIMRDRLDLAVVKGCDGVDPDNVNGFTNDTGFDITADDQLAFNRFLANEAHQRGLTVGLKNDPEQVPELVPYFDFEVHEQCHVFDECDALRPFINSGKPVFNLEYAEEFVTQSDRRASLCEDALGEDLRTVVLPVLLDDSFRFSCDPETVCAE